MISSFPKKPCFKLSHDQNEIIMICLEKQCNSNRLCCLDCIDEHKKHDLVSLNKFEQLMKNNMQNTNKNLQKGKIFNLLEHAEKIFMKNLKNMENTFQTMLSKIQQRIQNIFAEAYSIFRIPTHEDLMSDLCMNFYQQKFDQVLEALNMSQKYQFGNAQKTDLMLSRQIQIFKKRTKQISTQIEAKFKVLENLLNEIDVSSKINQEPWAFDPVNKYFDLKICDMRNYIEKQTSSGAKTIALGNRPMSPLNNRCSFRIVKNGEGTPAISLGVAIRAITKKNNFSNCIGYQRGTYAIDQSSNTSWGSLQQSAVATSWSHSHQSVCNNPLSFQLQEDDIVTVEIDYETHTILFERDDDLFEMDIDISHRDLYPFVGMYCKNSCVEIIDDE